MKPPLYAPGQPVVCTDSFQGDAGIPDPVVGHLYQVVAVAAFDGYWSVELREFPADRRGRNYYQEEAFAPANPRHDDAIAHLLAEALRTQVPAPQPVSSSWPPPLCPAPTSCLRPTAPTRCAGPAPGRPAESCPG